MPEVTDHQFDWVAFPGDDSVEWCERGELTEDLRPGDVQELTASRSYRVWAVAMPINGDGEVEIKWFDIRAEAEEAKNGRGPW